MFHRTKVFLTPEQHRLFVVQIAKETLRIGQLCLLLIGLFELANMLSLANHARSNPITVSFRFYFGMYLGLFAVTLFFFVGTLFLKKRVEKNAALIQTMAFFYSLLMALWSTVITLYDQRASENVSVYVITILTLAVLVNLKPWQAVMIFGGCQFLLLLLFTTFQRQVVDNRGNYLNTTVMTLLAIVVATTLYYNKRASFKDRQLLIAQKEEIVSTNAKLQELANTDSLSGLNNRRFMDALLPVVWNNCMKGKNELGIAMFDIDHFKEYNDRFGHATGDRCIQAIAQALLLETESNPSFVIRYGGEEFLIIMPFSEEREMIQLAESVLHRVRGLSVTTADGRITTSVSISGGMCSQVPTSDLTWEEWIRRADKALYRAKNNGRDRVEFYHGEESTLTIR